MGPVKGDGAASAQVLGGSRCRWTSVSVPSVTVAVM